MGFFSNLVNAALGYPVQPHPAPPVRLESVLSNGPHDGPPTHRIRQFTVHEALNGQYIEYMKRKYNPNGPDEYVREIYIVQSGESLVDAISAVLVILEK